MSLANCARCNKVFKKLFDRKICPDCIQAEEDAYRLVVDFLEGHPGSALAQIAEGSGVDEGLILRFIRDGRITLLDKLGGDASVECRRCGIQITSGQYCKPCKDEAGNQLRESAMDLTELADRALGRVRHAETLQEKRSGDSSKNTDRR